jgi:hypothetical protein
MAPMEDKPEDGEAYDSDLEGQSVRLSSGRTGTVMCRSCSCYSPYEVQMDDTGERLALSCVDFALSRSKRCAFNSVEFRNSTVYSR